MAASPALEGQRCSPIVQYGGSSSSAKGGAGLTCRLGPCRRTCSPSWSSHQIQLLRRWAAMPTVRPAPYRRSPSPDETRHIRGIRRAGESPPHVLRLSPLRCASPPQPLRGPLRRVEHLASETSPPSSLLAQNVHPLPSLRWSRYPEARPHPAWRLPPLCTTASRVSGLRRVGSQRPANATATHRGCAHGRKPPPECSPARVKPAQGFRPISLRMPSVPLARASLPLAGRMTTARVQRSPCPSPLRPPPPTRPSAP